MKTRPDLSRGPQIFILDRGRILFEDEAMIVVDKPPGLPSQATLDPRRHHLSRAVKIYLEKQFEAQAMHDGGATAIKPYVGEHQRLDLDTSGAIVFSKTKAANPGLARQLSSHTIEKVYLAIVGAAGRGKKLPAEGQEWSVENHLARGTGRPARMRSVRSGGDWAETQFRALSTSAKSSLVEARPRTGRTHQIRVHLAEGGLPILGDELYATEALIAQAPRLMLHAWRLSIDHPLTGERMVFEAPPPSDFKSTLERMGLRLDGAHPRS